MSSVLHKLWSARARARGLLPSRAPALILGTLIGLGSAASSPVAQQPVVKTDIEAVIDLGRSSYAVRHDPDWRIQAFDNRTLDYQQGRIPVRLKPQALDALTNCILGKGCVQRLKPEWLKDGTDNESDATATSDIYASRLTKRIAVAQTNETYPWHVKVFFDLESGQVWNLSRPDRVQAYAASLDSIVYSDCGPNSSNCDIELQSLSEEPPRKLITVKGQIQDLRFSNGAIQVLATRSTGRSGLFDGIFSVMGHPPSREQWLMIVVDYPSLKTSEASLVKELVNAYGKFICKWCFVDK